MPADKHIGFMNGVIKMLLLLYDLLTTEYRFGRLRFSSWHVVVIGYFLIVIKNREAIFTLKDLWFYIPLVLIVSGLLNNPYRKIVNNINIFLNKVFGKRLVILYGGIIKFSNKQKDIIGFNKNIIGVVCGDAIYMDDYYEKQYPFEKRYAV